MGGRSRGHCSIGSDESHHTGIDEFYHTGIDESYHTDIDEYHHIGSAEDCVDEVYTRRLSKRPIDLVNDGMNSHHRSLV